MYPITCDIPLTKRSIITYSLCVLTIIIFALQHIDFVGIPVKYGFMPNMRYDSPWYTFFTHSLLHSRPMHLFSNLLFMIVFMARVEEKTTRLFFITLVLASSGLSGIGLMISEPNSMQPLIGMSGVVYGSVGVFAILFRHVRVGFIMEAFHIWIPLYVPSIFLIILMLYANFVYATVFQFSTDGPARVAWESHLVAFFIGMTLTFLFNRFGKVLR